MFEVFITGYNFLQEFSNDFTPAYTPLPFSQLKLKLQSVLIRLHCMI